MNQPMNQHVDNRIYGFQSSKRHRYHQSQRAQAFLSNRSFVKNWISQLQMKRTANQQQTREDPKITNIDLLNTSQDLHKLGRIKQTAEPKSPNRTTGKSFVTGSVLGFLAATAGGGGGVWPAGGGAGAGTAAVMSACILHSGVDGAPPG